MIETQLNNDNSVNQVEFVENKELNRYTAELEKDVSLTVTNLREKSLLVSTIRSKWLSYYMKEKENMQRIQNTKTKILKSRMSDPSANTSVLRVKSEEALTQNDERLQKLSKLMQMTKENIDFIERAMNILSDFVWQIKNAIEIMKLQSI
jgi:ElaB/YqjD/DUF883 family membrane-anchored ribosome-binding protein